MRRLALVFLLLWLPLHWSWAATLALSGHLAAAEHAGHAVVLESMSDGEAADPAGPACEQEEDCPLCQAADWQAALPATPGFAPADEPPPRFDDTPPFKSYVPPVPKPPARLLAA
jgi:hypothetical protein